ARQRVADRALRRPRARPPQLRHRSRAHEPAVLAGRGGHDARRDDDRLPRDQQRPLRVVRGGAGRDGVPDLRPDAVPPASAGAGLKALEPIDRVSEVLFGLIMVLTFTGSLSVAEAGREDVRTMLVGALGCNIAWGIIDGVLYLMGSLADRARALMSYRAVREAADPQRAQALIADALPPLVASILPPTELEAMRRRLMGLPEPPVRARLGKEDWLGALSIFFLVFVSTLPVVVPFIVMPDARPALRVSNGIAIALLFVAGHAFGRMTGRSPVGVG